MAVAAADPGAGANPPGQIPPSGQASAEIRLASPTHYAIVLHEPGKIRTLYASGDTIFDPRDPTRSLTVERVELAAMIVRAGRWGRAYTLRAGSAIPGFPGLTFTRTVLLEAVEYRFKVVDRIVHPDPVLVALEGSRGVLEVETLRVHTTAASLPSHASVLADSPARAMLDAGTLKQVRVREVGPDLYEVPTADVRPVLDNVGRVLVDLAPTVLPLLSRKEGLQYQITSAASDGILTNQGFVVTSPKMAGRAGIELGDRILSVNGTPVDSLGSLYGIYRQVQRDPGLSMVRVDLERRGTHLTKTYRIR
jgi:membrane-associated protease RseP (regulator of RpoE activity)